MKRTATESMLAICINNTGYEMSLERRKVYRVLPDESYAQHDFVRVVDETGEDYLFPASIFILIPVTPEVEKAVVAGIRA